MIRQRSCLLAVTLALSPSLGGMPSPRTGGALVAVRGEVVLAKGYGLADRAQWVPITFATVFDIGSDKRGITLHQLLTHTAGLDRYYGTGDFDVLTREELVRNVFSRPLKSRSDTVHEYSNGGFSMLAAVVEVVRGEPYDSYLRGHVLAPAGMGETGYSVPGLDPRRLAHHYVGDADQLSNLTRVKAAPGPLWNLVGNGGLHSTLWDLYRWDLALKGDAVLLAGLRARYFAPQVPEDSTAGSFAGYGWVVQRTTRGTTLVRHNRSDMVFTTDLRATPTRMSSSSSIRPFGDSTRPASSPAWLG